MLNYFEDDGTWSTKFAMRIGNYKFYNYKFQTPTMTPFLEGWEIFCKDSLDSKKINIFKKIDLSFKINFYTEISVLVKTASMRCEEGFINPRLKHKIIYQNGRDHYRQIMTDLNKRTTMEWKKRNIMTEGMILHWQCNTASIFTSIFAKKHFASEVTLTPRGAAGTLVA